MPEPDKSDFSPLSPRNSDSSQKIPRGEVFDVDISSNIPSKKSSGKFIGLGVLGFVVALGAAFIFGGVVTQSSQKPVPVGPFPSVKVEATKPIVNVTGQVKKPGVYTLSENARIQDAIKKAGGALPNADLNALNLAAWVEDGSKIVVPSKIKKVQPTPLVIVQQIPAETPPPRMGAPYEPAPPIVHNQPIIVNSQPQPAPAVTAAPVAPAPTSSSVVPEQADVSVNDNLPRGKTKSGATSSNISTDYLRTNPLDINSATATQLEGLPDVGPRMAARIIMYRNVNGPFRSVEELDNVIGIGAKTLAKLKPYVVAK